MAYVRGNLAVQPKRKPQIEERYRETTKTVVRKASLPGPEKLLYLLTIVFCVGVAMFLIGRYAEIYSMNRSIQQVIRDTEMMYKDTLVLEAKREEVSRWERIEAEALKNGLVWPDKLNDIKVEKQDFGE